MREERGRGRERERNGKKIDSPRYAFGICKAAFLGCTFEFSKKLSNISGDRRKEPREGWPLVCQTVTS